MTTSRSSGPGGSSATGRLRAVLVRLVLLAAAWWALVEGDTSVLGYGLVVVPLVTALSLRLASPAPPRPRWGRRVLAGAGLGLWLLRQAFVGGFDVARRAVTPQVDVDPHWTTYRTGLADETARVVLVLVMNLLPGSLSASLRGDDGDLVDVHVISPDLDVEATLRELERRLGVVLGR